MLGAINNGVFTPQDLTDERTRQSQAWEFSPKPLSQPRGQSSLCAYGPIATRKQAAGSSTVLMA